MTDKAIEISNLTKSYGAHFTLSGIDLTIKKGEVFALVGQNGAGKTTLVKLILDLLRAREGEIKIFGSSHRAPESRLKLGFIPEKFSFFSFYTVEGVLNFFADSRGIAKEKKAEVVNHAIERLSLTEIRHRKLSTFSKGQVQRVGLATLLIGDLDLLILDEPFSGLDPLGIKDLKNLIRDFKEKGKTIFLNSHILLEMEMLCDSFAIINQGKLIHHGSVADLKKENTTLEDFFTTKITQN